LEKLIKAGGDSKSIAWLSFLAFLSVLNETIFNVSLPDIAVQFGIAPSSANWVNTSFILTFAIGTALYGKLSDLYGVKKLLLFGLWIYSAGSLIGILFQTWYPGVLAARLIQGAGVSAVPALIVVIIARCIDTKHQGKAFGMVGSMVACGEGIGPVLGGLITEYLHWSMLFLLPIMTLLTIPFFMRTMPDEASKKGKTDIIGAVLLSVGIVAFTLFTTTYQWGFLAVSLLLFFAFGLRIRYVEQPFIKPYLFEKRTFIVGVLTGSLLLGTVAGYVSMVPYMMKEVYQLPTSLIGIGVLFPGTVSVVLFGFVGGVLVDKLGTVFTMLVGLFMIGASFLSVSLFPDRMPWLVSGAMVLTFGGLSFVKTVVSTIVAGALGSEESGSGMGFLNFACFLGEGIGVAAVGGLLTKSWLAFPLLPTVTVVAAFHYSNLILIFIAALVMGAIGFLYAYGQSQRSSEMTSAR
jgi:MFS transporter, DHA2 family, metal-tetracycline-proton antiporter